MVEINEGGGPGVEVWNGGGCAGTMEEDERSRDCQSDRYEEYRRDLVCRKPKGKAKEKPGTGNVMRP